MWLAESSVSSEAITPAWSWISHGSSFGLHTVSASIATASGTESLSVSTWYTMFSRDAVHATAAPSRSASRTIMSADLPIDDLKAMCCSTCEVPGTLS